LIHRDQLFHRDLERGKFLNLADARPADVCGLGKKRVKGEAEERDRERGTHDHGTETQEHAEK
jgi:hypothetical protein